MLHHLKRGPVIFISALVIAIFLFSNDESEKKSTKSGQKASIFKRRLPDFLGGSENTETNHNEPEERQDQDTSSDHDDTVAKAPINSPEPTRSQPPILPNGEATLPPPIASLPTAKGGPEENSTKQPPQPPQPPPNNSPKDSPEKTPTIPTGGVIAETPKRSSSTGSSTSTQVETPPTTAPAESESTQPNSQTTSSRKRYEPYSRVTVRPVHETFRRAGPAKKLSANEISDGLSNGLRIGEIRDFKPLPQGKGYSFTYFQTRTWSSFLVPEEIATVLDNVTNDSWEVACKLTQSRNNNNYFYCEIRPDQAYEGN